MQWPWGGGQVGREGGSGLGEAFVLPYDRREVLPNDRGGKFYRMTGG
jgi:hypothetical protein